MTLHILDDLEQGSDEWLDARRGIITASVVSKLLTPTGRVASNDYSRALTLELAAERITGESEFVFVNDDMQRGNEVEPWGEHYGWAIQGESLPAGQSTREIVLRSGHGYTGKQPRQQMLTNKEFVDAKVEIFLKQGSRVWAKLAEFPIERQLLTK